MAKKKPFTYSPNTTVKYYTPLCDPTLYDPSFKYKKIKTFNNRSKTYPQVLVEKGWHKKIWARYDEDLRICDIWPTIKFLSDDVFYRGTKNRMLYHVCGVISHYIFFSLIPKGKTACHCGVEIDPSILILKRLQTIK